MTTTTSKTSRAAARSEYAAALQAAEAAFQSFVTGPERFIIDRHDAACAARHAAVEAAAARYAAVYFGD